MPSLDQWMTGIAKAERAGDTEAAAYLREQAQAELTGPGNAFQRVGAGMQDIVTGGKQLLGMTEPGEVEEQHRMARSADPSGVGRFAGQMALTAPLMLAPGGQTVPGAIATGAAAGALMPTQGDDNVMRDKLLQAGFGGAAGGAIQKFAPAAISMFPKALKRMQESAARTFPKALPGTKQRLAEEGFVNSIPQAERVGVVNELTNYAPPSELPNFQQTSAAAARNPALLAAERQLVEAGGEIGAPLRARGEQQSAAVGAALEREFGGGQAEQARQAATDFGGDILGGMRLSPKLLNSDQVFASTRRMLADHAKRSTGTVRKSLMSINDELENAIAVARETGSYEPLHQLRIAEMGDTLSKLTREGASGTEKQLRPIIDKLKDSFDTDMSALTGGRWQRFIEGYSERATEAGQREAGADWVEKLAARPQYASGQPMAGGLMPGLRKEVAPGMQALDKYGKPTYTPGGERVLRKTLEQMEQAKAPFAPDVGPRGSATAQNLGPMNKVLEDARKAQAAAGRIGLGDVATGAAGFATLGPLGALAGVAKAYGIDPMRAKAMTNIAERMVKMYANPQDAINALINQGVGQQLSAPERKFLIDLMRGAVGPAAGVGASDAMR